MELDTDSINSRVRALPTVLQGSVIAYLLGGLKERTRQDPGARIADHLPDLIERALVFSETAAVGQPLPPREHPHEALRRISRERGEGL